MKKTLLSSLMVCLSYLMFSQQPSLNITNNTGTYTITCVTPSINLTASVNPSNSSLTYSWFSQAAVYSGANVSIATPGVYTVTASNTSISVSQTLMIRTNTYVPQATISPGNYSLTCNSPTLALNGYGTSGIPPASGFPNFQAVICTSFSGPSTSVNTCSYAVATPGTYTLTVTDLNNGCKASATKMVFDSRIYPALDPASQPVNILCPNATATISPNVIGSTQNLSYSWTPPSGAVTSAPNMEYLTVNSPGTYAVVVTNTLNGCASNALIDVVVCVGLSEHNLVNFKLYPNPTTNDLYIRGSIEKLRSVQIYSSAGRFIRELSISEENSVVSVSDLPEGIYFVKILSERSSSAYTKLVKIASD